MMDMRLINTDRAVRYFLAHVAAGDHPRARGQSLRQAQHLAGVPAGRWTGRGLPLVGLQAGQLATEEQLVSLFGHGEHPDAARIRHALQTQGASACTVRRAGALGQRAQVTGVELIFRAPASVHVLWALGGQDAARAIENAHETAITQTLAWIEDEAAQIRSGRNGQGPRHRPEQGLLAAQLRHYASSAHTPLLHDHLLVALKGLRPDGRWRAVHSTTLLNHAVAAGTLYDELVLAETCHALGLATCPRTVTPGRRPVMELAGLHEPQIIAWMALRNAQITAHLQATQHTLPEPATRDDADGPVAFPAPFDARRERLQRIAVTKTLPPPRRPPALPELRDAWHASASHAFGPSFTTTLLDRARTASAPVRAQRPAAIDVDKAAREVIAMVAATRSRGRFRTYHLLAQARRHLAYTLRGARRPPGLDAQIVNQALTVHARDVTGPTRDGSHPPAFRIYTAA
ncbi:MobF family relaxase [Streptomyces sp. NPDC001941]|uniref:MobF family relaxase n=1 Tax=Streptomyces sp. NPDC001941 TaxID=3154659 RepID=UPI003324178E